MKPGSRHTEEARKRMSLRMSAIYADPELRERVAANTARTWRDGTRRRSRAMAAQLDKLEAVWAESSKSVQLAFIARRLGLSAACAAPRAPSRRRTNA